MKWLRVKQIYLIFVFVFALNSIARGTYNDEYLFENLYFSSTHINCILKDHNGFLWFGTEQGLIRFDGYETIKYTSNDAASNGLSHNNIKALALGKDGSIWIGTFGGGVTIFDQQTESFTHCLPDSDTLAVSGINVNDLIIDKNGNAWIGYADNGLDRIDYKTGKVTNFRYQPHSKHSIISNGISALYFDGSGNLWIGTWAKGICVLTKEQQAQAGTNPKVQFKDFPYINKNLGLNKIFDIEVDPYGMVWLTSFGDGVYAYNTANQKYLNLSQFTGFNPEQRKNGLRSILQNGNGDMLFGCDESFFMVSSNTVQTVYRYLNDSTRFFSADSINLTQHHLTENITKLNVYSFYEDNQLNIWIATNSGVFKYRKSLFNRYTIFPDKQENNNIVSFAESSSNVFFSIWEKGIFKMPFSQIRSVRPKPEKLPVNPQIFDRVTCLLPDSRNNLWISTMDNGTFYYNFKNGEIASPQFNFQPNQYENINYIITTTEGPDNTVWFGTAAGLIAHFPKEQYSMYYTQNIGSQNNLSSNYITSVLFENDTTIWVGTLQDGLNKGTIDKSTLPWRIKFTNYLFRVKNKHSISGNSITCLYKTGSQQIWIGTRNNGINLYRPEKDDFIHYSKKQGTGSNHISAILHDNSNNLWVATTKGLTKFNIQDSTYFTYPVFSLNENHFFTQNASLKAMDGTLIFGTKKGYIAFVPEQVRIPKNKSPLVFTAFKVNNNVVHVGQKINNQVILKQSIASSRKITLEFENNSFSVFFSLLNYSPSANIVYQYKLQGFDNDWISLNPPLNFANYNKIPSGNYVFKVRGYNLNNYWNQNQAHLQIKVLPPWYKTIYAYIVYVLIFMSFSYIIRKLSVARANYRNEIEMQKMLREKENELMDSKMKFFVNISHEIRTPVTLIIAPLRNLCERVSNSEIKQQLETVLRNALKLNQLIDQLMDFRKIEQKHEKLRVFRYDIKLFIQEIVDEFRTLASQKNIDFRFSTNCNELFVWFDNEKMNKVFRNILSNAFKFTPENGRIEVKLYQKKDTDGILKTENHNEAHDMVIVEVTDNGIGIPQEHLSRVFDRFYQVERNSTLQHFKGTGIGLSIVKEYIKMHKGHISIKSTPNIETTFTVYLLLGKAHFAESNISSKPHNIEKIPLQDEINFTPESIQKIERNESANDKPVILIAEDNEELLAFLTKFFKAEYSVVCATDGTEALHSISKFNPDLIISDIMMPGMNGLELARKIKTDIRTCHIPVILLTAKGAIENRIEGLETGADSYIPKPFHTKHLKVRVEKLLELRNTLKQKFSNDFSYQVDTVNINSLDKQFIQKLTDYVEENLNKPELNVESLSTELGMSRSNLFKKLKSLLGVTPSQFTRTIRLNNAAKILLNNTGLNIAEVSYQVGFNSPAYFTQCFRQHFGLPPKEFIENHKKSL